LFGCSNPYALSNNTKLSLLFKGRDINVINNGLEQFLIKETEMKKIESEETSKS
jgi:hypothetical protein